MLWWRRKNSRKSSSDGSSNNTELKARLKGSHELRIETHNINIDKFCPDVNKKIEAYKFVLDNFIFIIKLYNPIDDSRNEYEERTLSKALIILFFIYKEDVNSNSYITNLTK